MLMLTENATRVIGALVDNPEMPDGAGLRIATAADGLTVSAAGAPEETDQVLEDQSARVFLEPGAAAALDDQVLDAEVDDAGRVQFLLGPQ
jgi:iron-sulfur cluster assembly protein